MSDKRPANMHDNRLNQGVFHGSAAGILIFLVYAIAFTDRPPLSSTRGSTGSVTPSAGTTCWLSSPKRHRTVPAGTCRIGQAGRRHAPGQHLYLPRTATVGRITAPLVTVLSIVFFVTSADSGALVLSNFAYILRDVNHDAPIRLRIFWSAVIFLTMIGLYRSLRAEMGKIDARHQVAAGPLAVGDWRERLDRTLDGSTCTWPKHTIDKLICSGAGPMALTPFAWR